MGTFEFLVRSSPPEYYFLEVNPRLQVEHTITESLALGCDLVQIQLLLAQGHALSSLSISGVSQDPVSPPPLHSLQLRVTAEDVSNDWALSVGKINYFRMPSGNGIRVDTHLLPSQATVVGTDFDSLIAKIIITAPTWEDVLRKAKRALVDTYVEGVKTNLDILNGIVHSQAFAHESCDTQWLEANVSSLLTSGKAILAKSKEAMSLIVPTANNNTSVAPASNVLFRKGDAWSISLTPEIGLSTEPNSSSLIHLQLSRVLRNEFPASMTAQVTYTSPTIAPTSYLMTLASTTASFGSVSSGATHRRGEPGNGNHIITPFPGTLVELLVYEGDEVKQGSVIAVVRQMKMELEIKADKAGTIVWVYEGDEGDEVGEGILIAELDTGRESKL